MHVTQCLVRDGLGWSEQGLINEEGCPQVFTTSKIIITVVITILFAAHTIVHMYQDYEIMGELEYSSSKTTALVKFQAHKFPYTRFFTHTITAHCVFLPN